jgi:hypothetical protein
MRLRNYALDTDTGWAASAAELTTRRPCSQESKHFSSYNVEEFPCVSVLGRQLV